MSRLAAFGPLIAPLACSALAGFLGLRYFGQPGLGAALAGAGLWLLLPRGRSPGRKLGAVLGLIGLGILAGVAFKANAPTAPSTLIFYLLAAATIVSAVGAVTMKSPVYCALWFALTLLGTAGLMLYQGAQFLGLATIVVYAGAILVTFLFVLMLAQPEGHSYYDRVSWDALASSAAGAVLVGMFTTSILATGDARAPLDRGGDVLHADHAATLGGELFSRHLVAVELAGTLLLVALVGAVAIVGQARGKTARAAAPGGSSHG